MINYQIGKLYKLTKHTSLYKHSINSLLYGYEHPITTYDIFLLIESIEHIGAYCHFKILTDKGTIGWIWANHFDNLLEPIND